MAENFKDDGVENFKRCIEEKSDGSERTEYFRANLPRYISLWHIINQLSARSIVSVVVRSQPTEASVVIDERFSRGWFV